MGDRCYMEVRCQKEHVPLFEPLGFTLQGDYPLPPGIQCQGLVELVDEEANYAHDGKMPTHIPYFGWHGEGGDYGSMAFACDGKLLVFCDLNKNGEPVVRIRDDGKPGAQDLKRFMAYAACARRAKKALGFVRLKKRGQARVRSG